MTKQEATRRATDKVCRHRLLTGFLPLVVIKLFRALALGRFFLDENGLIVLPRRRACEDAHMDWRFVLVDK